MGKYHISLSFLSKENIGKQHITVYTRQSMVSRGDHVMPFCAEKSLCCALFRNFVCSQRNIISNSSCCFYKSSGYRDYADAAVSYWKKNRGPFIKSIQAKYPIIEKLRDLRKKNEVIFCFAARMMRIPGDIVSLYMGAAQVNYKKYLLGSILGAIPHTITYPIMGMSAFNLSSSQFILAFCAEVIYFLITTVIYTIYTRKHYRKFK